MFVPGNRSSAGFPSPADDYIDKALDLNELLITNKVATFFMRVDGDDLLASGIHHGDLLIVDRSLTPAPGKTVVAVVDGAVTVKTLALERGQYVLQPANPAFETIHAGVSLEVLGVVVGSFRRYT